MLNVECGHTTYSAQIAHSILPKSPKSPNKKNYAEKNKTRIPKFFHGLLP